MPTNNHFETLLTCFAHLSASLLHAPMLYLDRKLVLSDGIDYSTVPKPVRVSYEELFFGGILFQCAPFTPYEIRTAFNVFFTAMQLDSVHGFILIGPYLPEEAPADELEDLLVQNKVPLTEKAQYRSYLQTLPVLTQPKLQSVLNAFACQLNDGTVAAIQRSMELSPDSPSPCPVFDEDSLQARADMLALRYQRENSFLESVLRGEVEPIGLLSSIKLNRLPNKLRNEKNQLIILNTLLRKVIEGAQVHPYYIDQISAKWAVRVETATTLDELEQTTTDIVGDYCRLVQRYSLAHYTPTVRAMINFVNFNLASPTLTLQKIAEALGGNLSYLSRQFNKELGKSLPEYIKQQRIAQAKRLLRGGDVLSVGQISAAVGFADMNYFSKVFRQATGTTPTDYRRHSSASAAQGSAG